MHALVFTLMLLQETPPDASPVAAAAPADATPIAPAAVRPKLLVLDVKSGDLSRDQVEALTSLITARAHRFAQTEVVSSQDIRDLAQLEAEKQQAGCEDGSSCLAELAGALGAKYVLSTRAGKLGSTYVVSAQVFDADKGTAEARDTAEAWDIVELPSKVAPLVDGVLTTALGEPVAGAAPLPVAPPRAEPRAPLRLGLQVGGAAAMGVGALVAGLGVTPYVLYQQRKGELNTRTANYTGDADELAAATRVHADAVGLANLYNNVGRFALFGGLTLVLAGGGALAAGFLFPLDEQATAGAAP